MVTFVELYQLVKITIGVCRNLKCPSEDLMYDIGNTTIISAGLNHSTSSMFHSLAISDSVKLRYRSVLLLLYVHRSPSLSRLRYQTILDTVPSLYVSTWIVLSIATFRGIDTYVWQHDSHVCTVILNRQGTFNKVAWAMQHHFEVPMSNNMVAQYTGHTAAAHITE